MPPSDLLAPILETYRFNSKLVALGLADLDPDHAVRRLKAGAGSSIAYLTGHLCSSRYGLLKTLGAAEDNPYQELFGLGAGSRDGSAYPPLPELAAGWDDTAARLHEALESVTDERARQPGAENLPTGDRTLRGQLAFIAWHESYHVGQIGLLRTEMGYPSLRQRLLASRGGST
ncbi:MAG: DinB family protein [Thermoanaerobaculia bacterium]|nr:DinB family protein [Thermoanaerobaculia bacterium]